MRKTVVFGEGAIERLKETVKAGSESVSPNPVEADEYTIGSEAGPVPVGGTNFHITEGILKEGLSQNLYHFTGLDAAFKICSDDVIYLQSAYSKESDNYDKKRKFYLSCARQPNVKMGFASKCSNGGVRISLDGDKLSQRFAGKAVNYWAGDTFMNKHRYYQHLAKDEEDLMSLNRYEIDRLKRDNPDITDDEIKQYLVKNYNPEVQKHLDNEIEDRLLSYEPAIYDAHKYIKSIDVFIPGVFEDEEKMSEAAAFLYNTFLGRSGYVKLFDSLEQFSHPHGQPVNDKIPYKWDQMYNHKNAKQSLDCLIGVVGFITYGDDAYAGENFGPAVAKLLKKYGLEKYTKDIGRIKDAFRWYSVQSVAEKADSIRRELSDEPSEDKSKMLKMLTDYCLSIGADNFRQAYVIKKKQEDNKYNKVYDRIDTSVKLPYVIVGNYVISLNPDKDKFIDAVGWNEEDCKNYAEMLAYEAYENQDGKYNNKGSKNYNSMFFYIYKMLRSGTVKQVMDGFNKIGFDYEYLSDWGMGISVQDMDYWDAVRKETVLSMQAKRSGADYKSVNSIRDKGVEQYIASKTVNESVNGLKELITEGAESRNMSAAKHYLYNNFGYDEAKAMQLIGSIKTDIPNVRLAKCKFILGVTRMCMTGELKDARTIMSVNKTLKLVASDTHVNEYDQNLNNFTAEQLVEKFATASQADLEGDMNDVYSQQYGGNTSYNIVRIDSFEQACQYGNYTTWCVTHDNGMFDSYTAEGLNVFYFCLKQGFEEVPRYKGEGCPLDEYGLSMIAVSVCPDGSLNTCTCRWNHDNGDNDQIMTTKEISNVIGMNFYEVFKPISEEEYTQRLITAIEDGGKALENLVKGDFVIPEGTRCIGPEAFAYCDGLKSIVIPNSVTYIGDEAFDYCRGLKSIVIPNSVEEIGENAFFECRFLQSVQIHNQQARIEPYAFDSCVRLTSINLPMNLEKIESGVFHGCMSLTSIVIPNRVSSIGRYAFIGCEKLQSIKLPFGLKRIGEQAFHGCHSLQSINLPVGLSVIGKDAFARCSSLNEVNIPWTVTDIESRAFYDCTELRKVVISKNVRYIGSNAFSGCNRGLTIYTDHPDINELFDEVPYRILPMSALTESVQGTKVLSESYSNIRGIDMSEVGEVGYSSDFDEDDYIEFLADEGMQDTPESRLEYFKTNVTYDLDIRDNDTRHTMFFSDGCYDDLVDAFGEKIANRIVTDSMNGEEGTFDTYEMYEDENVDVNDPYSIAAYAEKVFRHGGYTKDCRGFILADGVVIYTEAEHNQVCSIPGINSKFDFIRLGNIRVLDHSIDIGSEPTKEQYAVLNQIASAYAGDVLYLDIFSKDGGEIGVQYQNTRPSYVVGEIKRYYSEGIKPQGSSMYEGKLNEEAIPTQYDDDINRLSSELSALSDEMTKKYRTKFWFSKALHPDLNVDVADMEKRKSLHAEYNKLKELRDAEYRKEEERQRFEKAQENARKYQEEQRIIDLAVDYFGITSNILDAGYILPDGRYLNFGRSDVADDHRSIAGIYMGNNIPIWDDKYRYNYVVDFMNRGAIRCDANTGLLDMTREPSKEQYAALKIFVRKAGDVDIDFTNNVGDVDHSVSYSNASPLHVIADIQKYYQEGIKPQGNVQFEGKDKKKVIKENLEDEVEASDVDLTSFKPRETLEPNLWKDGVLDSKIRMKLLDIADDFWDFLGIDWAEPEGIHLTGSICGFNYSRYSDIDLHIVADFSQIDSRTKFVRQYMDEKKAAWNSAHPDLNIMGYAVELYVEDVNDTTTSEGVYDLEKNEWISKPEGAMELSSEDSIKNKAADIMTIIDGMESVLNNTDDERVSDEVYNDAILMFKKLKAMRNSSLSSDGESGVGNIVYKTVRRAGYLDKLVDIVNRAYDKSNSIDEIYECVKTLFENRILFEEPDGGFDAWYGNSVLRDENGNPIKMYHGTDKKFDKFDKAFIGSSGSGSFEGYGFNFTPFQTRAGHYSSPEGEVWEAYLKAEHPLANDKRTITPRKLMDIIRKLDEGLPVTDTLVPAYEPPKYGEKWDERYYNRALPIAAKMLYEYSESDADLYAVLCGGGTSSPKRVIDVFESLGYDSCILKDNDGRLNTVVVFEPEQIMRCSAFEGHDLHESIEENIVQDEVVADGSSTTNPYSKRWKAEREALKNFLVNFGKIMTSKENGKQYKVYFDETMSNLIGYNYCICVQWDPIEMIPSSVPYIRALDKFTSRIFQPHFDTRGFDNIQGTADDVVVPESVKPRKILKEYLEENGVDLYDYLREWEDADVDTKVRDIYDKAPWAFREYFEKFNIPVDYDDENGVFEWFDVHTNRYDHFLRVVTDFCDWVDLPLWFHVRLTDQPLVKNEWLIHWSDNAYNVSQEGFKFGCSDKTKLGLTRWLDTDDLNGQGYNFAYRLTEKNMNENWKYGKGAVIFRASGVEVHHYNDNENQVIFWGPTAKDFVWVTRDHTENGMKIEDMKTGRVIAHFKDVDSLLRWFETNNHQYRKRIFNTIETT